MKAIVSAAVVLIVIAVALGRGGWSPSQLPPSDGAVPAAALEGPAAALEGPAAARSGASRDTAAAVRLAFEERAEGRQLLATGRVTRILADDRDGSPHQRFIIATEGGPTLLVAHNLDLAPRLDGLKSGDAVSVYGEYEWNPQGGVMHWTHDDPRGVHPTGYIEWRGRRYQ